MKILITGAAGYIGTSLVDKLHTYSEVEKITVLDNLSRPDINFFFSSTPLSKVDFIKGDILDSFGMEKIMKDIDVVVHLAGFVAQPFNHHQNLQYEQVNTWGSLSVVRAIQNTASVKNVIYLSSTSVYGFRENVDISEEPTPENAYGQSKYDGEKYFTLLKDSLNLSIVRAGNVFGYNRSLRTDSVINSFFINALTQNKIHIFGDGMQSRPFVSIENITKSLENAIFHSRNTGNTHIAADFNATLNDIKDFLLSQIENLEYQYLNQNQRLSSQQIIHLPPFSDSFLLPPFETFVRNMGVRSSGF